MKFGVAIHGSQMMNPDNFSELLTFHLVPPAGQGLHLSSEISQNLLDVLAQILVQIFLFPKG